MANMVKVIYQEEQGPREGYYFNSNDMSTTGRKKGCSDSVNSQRLIAYRILLNNGIQSVIER